LFKLITLMRISLCIALAAGLRSNLHSRSFLQKEEDGHPFEWFTRFFKSGDQAAAIKAQYPKTFSTPDLYAKYGIAKDAAAPVEWTAPSVPGKSCLNRPEGDALQMNAFWADPEVEQIPQTSADAWGKQEEFKKWRATCGEHKKLRIPLRERTSLEGSGELHFFPDGRPMNPVVFAAGGGVSTGLKGRGTLGQWGPNPAADPVVARFHEGKWQVVVIQRGDTDEAVWAIPGGMVDSAEYVQRKIGEDPRPDERTMRTALRELHEEAIRGDENHDTAGDEEDTFFDQMIEISELLYNGYVDDARNGDNAWMETSSYLFNMEKNGELSKIGARLELHAGDDAKKSAWMDMEDFEGSATPMFSETHRMFINRAYAAVRKWKKANP